MTRRIHFNTKHLNQPIVESNNDTVNSAPPIQEDAYWRRLASGTEEDYYWRRLSDNWFQKDLLPSTYLEIHNACYEAYHANPIANYIVEITTNFVLGHGISVTATSPAVQKVLDRFWSDPDNHMNTRVYSLCTELSLYGEQFIRFFVNPYDGSVKISQIDPSLIDEIETDPDNVERIIRIHRRAVGPGTSGGATSPVAGSLLEPEAQLAGDWFSCPEDVVQFAINKVSNAKRGISDLATLLPWLRRYRDWLTDRVRINKYKAAFLWDIKLLGADRKTIDRKRMEYSFPPDPGSIVVHNESEEWTAVQPAINADDVSQDGRAIKMMIAVGAGLPEHYLSEGGSVNHATASEMGLPTYRKFQRRQDQFTALMTTILDRVLAEALRAGSLPRRADLSYIVHMPELAPDDNTVAAQATASMVQALTLAKSQGWISDETAMSMMFATANQPVSVNEELARLHRHS